MTCDNTTDVCPGTELTCNCSTNISNNTGLIWALPGSKTITFDIKDGVGMRKNSTTTNDIIFFAVVTNNTGGIMESMLIYTATESLVDDTIKCSGHVGAMSTTITVTLAG